MSRFILTPQLSNLIRHPLYQIYFELRNFGQVEEQLTTLPVLRYDSGHRKGRLKILSVYALVRNAFLASVLRCAVSALRRVLFRERRSRCRMGKSQRQEVGIRWIRRSDLTWPRTPVRGFFIL